MDLEYGGECPGVGAGQEGVKVQAPRLDAAGASAPCV